MARLVNGILGGIRGAVGNLEGYMLNGEYIIRSRRRKSKKPPSEKQLVCRKKMVTVNDFLTSLTPYVMLGFSHAAAGKNANGYNMAIGYQIQHAISGQYPDYHIDYTKVRLTNGLMDNNGINATVQFRDNRLVFTWTPDLSYTHSSDRVMLLAYSPALNEAVYTLCGARRISGTDILLLPDNTWNGTVTEIYLSFISENRKQCTNSLYLGQIHT